MAIFRCKMCGGDLEITEGQAVCICDFCGTEQTLPRLDSDRKANLYDRANHFRRNNDFDKAMGIYEQILNEDNTDAEAYWSLVLCRYGIEYVEDPSTHKRIPTINRAQYTSVYADENYKSALEYAETSQKIVYEQEAKTIDEIQKGILAISEKEEPFDVFICYKESDETGRRTPDSVLANDLYHQLTQEGFKVFFSRITLEDKLGQEYEPYIFAALNSAKVMVVIGTKPEYFKAVWVRNEWARYLALIRGGAKKMLIPAYKDMDPYDLPEEFSHLQAQDMTKLGFMQDLIRGIKKIIGTNQPETETKEKVVISQGSDIGNAVALLDRGNMALEDGEWQKAYDFFEAVLNQNAKCAEAYLGELMSKCECSNVSELTRYYITEEECFETEELEACPEATQHIEEAVSKYAVPDYLADDEIRELYVFDRTYTSELPFRNQQKNRKLSELSNEKLLTRAKQYADGETKAIIDKMFEDIVRPIDMKISDAERADNGSSASVKIAYIAHLKDADSKVQELYNQAVEKREADYNETVSQMNAAKSVREYEEIRDLFKEIHDYKDSAELAEKCQYEIDRIIKQEHQEAERRAEKKKTIAKISAIAVAAIACIAVVTTEVIIPNNSYNKAVSLIDSGKYEEAIKVVRELQGYKGLTIDKCYELINENIYNKAIELRKYEEAITEFTALGDYKDKELVAQIELRSVLSASVGDIITFGNYNGNTEWIVLDKQDGKVLVISKHAIEKRPYNSSYHSVTWKSCTLRTWLNESYLTSAFSSAEQARIMSMTRSNPNNATYGTDGGNKTTDKVFLLSIDQAYTYFRTDNARKTTLPDGTQVWWWLRSPGYYSEYAADVSRDGSVHKAGLRNDGNDGAVRPALWIDISNL